MKTKVKRIIGTVCFVLIAAWMMHKLTFIFYPDDAYHSTFQTYERQKKNTVQVLCLGTSPGYCAFVVPQLWGEYGIAMYTLATGGQPFALTTDILDEALKSQSPDVILIDLHGLRSRAYNFNQSRVRPVTDAFSLIGKFRRMGNILDDAQDFYEEEGMQPTGETLNNKDYSYYFPLIKYHSRWKEGLTEKNFTGQVSEYLGYYNVFGHEKFEKTQVTTDTTELSISQTETLQEILDYGRKCDAKLVFTNVPSYLSYEEQVEINEAIRIIRENGYPVINMNTDEMYEELGIDFNKDLRNRNHVNVHGAEKVTKYMAQYLKETFNLKDCRGDSDYKNWDDAWELYQNRYESIIKRYIGIPELKQSESLDYDTVKITWGRVYCADGYVVYKMVEDQWEQQAVIADSNINYYCDTLALGENGTYTVRAYKKLTLGDKVIYGDYNKNGITASSAPSAPYLYEVTYEEGRGWLHWSKINGADGYLIYRKDGDQYSQIANIQDGDTVMYSVEENGTYIVHSYVMSGEKLLRGKCKETGIVVNIP